MVRSSGKADSSGSGFQTSAKPTVWMAMIGPAFSEERVESDQMGSRFHLMGDRALDFKVRGASNITAWQLAKRRDAKRAMNLCL